MLYIGILNLVFLLLLVLFFKMMADRRYRYKTVTRLIDHINVGYYRYRLKDGILLMANRGFFDILELDISPSEAAGRSLSEFLIYIDGEESINEKLREWKELRNHEFHFKTLEGKDKWVLHNSYITKDPLSREDVVEALIEDITEEKVSYEKMKNSQERYEKLFRNSGDMVIVYKFDDFCIEEVNPVTQVISGFDKKELRGKSFADLLHPSRRKEFTEAQKDLVFRGTARLESVIVTKTGDYKQVLLTLSLVELNENKIVMTVIKDISELVKEREEEYRRKKELENFWNASAEREQRIKDLRKQLSRASRQIEQLKGH